MRRIDCKGSMLRPCPAHAWWYAGRTGAPRIRCAACFKQEHGERRYVDACVKRGMQEEHAILALILHHSVKAVVEGKTAEGIRLLERAALALHLMSEAA